MNIDTKSSAMGEMDGSGMRRYWWIPSKMAGESGGDDFVGVEYHIATCWGQAFDLIDLGGHVVQCVGNKLPDCTAGAGAIEDEAVDGAVDVARFEDELEVEIVVVVRLEDELEVETVRY